MADQKDQEHDEAPIVQRTWPSLSQLQLELLLLQEMQSQTQLLEECLVLGEVALVRLFEEIKLTEEL